MTDKMRALLLGLPLLSLGAAVSAPLVFGTPIWVGVIVFFVTAPIVVAVIALKAAMEGSEEPRPIISPHREAQHEGRS